jgi:hypothetical protein
MFELLSLKVFNHQLDQSAEIGVHVDLIDYFSANRFDFEYDEIYFGKNGNLT